MFLRKALIFNSTLFSLLFSDAFSEISNIVLCVEYYEYYIMFCRVLYYVEYYMQSIMYSIILCFMKCIPPLYFQCEILKNYKQQQLFSSLSKVLYLMLRSCLIQNEHVQTSSDINSQKYSMQLVTMGLFFWLLRDHSLQFPSNFSAAPSLAILQNCLSIFNQHSVSSVCILPRKSYL